MKSMNIRDLHAICPRSRKSTGVAMHQGTSQDGYLIYCSNPVKRAGYLSGKFKKESASSFPMSE